VIQPGISILLRAGNNKQAAQNFLRQLIKVNTFRPIEVVLLFTEPQAKHLQLVREFAGKVRLVIRPFQGRTFANLTPHLRYDQVLILSTPLELKADVLPKASSQLRKSNHVKQVLEAPGIEKALLVRHSEMSRLAECLLTAAPNALQQALENKTDKVSSKPAQQKRAAARPKPPAKAATPSHAELDQQIVALEKELEQLDQKLCAQYHEIEQMDKHYESLQANSKEAETLKQQLKKWVFEANDTLKSLKQKHDDLERYRIRRYSIVA
jgi:hypothetical protein